MCMQMSLCVTKSIAKDGGDITVGKFFDLCSKTNL